MYVQCRLIRSNIKSTLINTLAVLCMLVIKRTFLRQSKKTRCVFFPCLCLLFSLPPTSDAGSWGHTHSTQTVPCHAYHTSAGGSMIVRETGVPRRVVWGGVIIMVNEVPASSSILARKNFISAMCLLLKLVVNLHNLYSDPGDLLLDLHMKSKNEWIMDYIIEH